MRINNLLYIFVAFLLSSCWNWFGSVERKPQKVLGYRPVYSSDSSLLRIYADAPQPIKNAGKIYAIGNLILQNEMGTGIHVIDHSNPAAPVNKGFLHIRGNTEMSVKNNYLYANSYTDLVVIDVSNWQQVTEVKRIKHAFDQGGQWGTNFFVPPPEHKVYYECLSPMGIHTGWVKDSVYDYNCYYP